MQEMHKRCGIHPFVQKIPWRRKWPATPVLLLENSMDRRAWRALIHGVAKSRTRPSTTNRPHTHTHTHTSLLYTFQFFSLLEEIFSNVGQFFCPFIIDMLWTFPPHFKMFFPNSSSQRMVCRLLSVPWPSFFGSAKSNLLCFHDNTKMWFAFFTKLIFALMG